MTTSYAGRLWASFTGTLGIASPWSVGDSLESVTLTDLYPGVDPDELAEIVPLSRASAMSVPAIAKCRNTLVTACAGLPLLPTNPRQGSPVAPGPLDPGRPDVVTMALVLDSLYFYGVAWLTKLPGPSSTALRFPVRFVEISRVETDEHGIPVKLDGRAVRPDELVRIDGVTDGILSPAAGLTIRRARRAEHAAARAMDNPVPSIELHQTSGEALSVPDRQALIKGWADARRGKNGGVAYTSPTVEAKTHGQAAEQLLINGRNASALDCARVSGMPAWVVDASVSGSSLTYSNVPSRSREFLDYTARGYLDAIAGRLSMDDVSPHGQQLRHDIGRLLRGDFRDRMEAGKIAIESGIYTADEIRTMDSDTPQETGIMPR